MTRVYTKDKANWAAAYGFTLTADPCQEGADLDQLVAYMEDMAAGNDWNVLSAGTRGLDGVEMQLSAARAKVQDGIVSCEVYTEITSFRFGDEDGPDMAKAVKSAADTTARGCQRRLRYAGGFPELQVRVEAVFTEMRRPPWAEA